MSETIEQRLDLIRNEMAKSNIDAYLVPRADEFLGEYVPPQNERLKWISGFSGSAGVAVILKSSAAIFVDGRYTIQVRQQVPHKLFEFYHYIDEPPIKWLTDNLPGESTIGFDSRMATYSWYEDSSKTLAKKKISLIEIKDNPIDKHWQNRPIPDFSPAMLLAETYTGEHSSSKRKRIGREVDKLGADCALITQLDSIAWLLNIRGVDVPRLPVLLSFATLSKAGEMVIYTDPRKLPNDFLAHVDDGVTVREMDELTAALTELGDDRAKVLADPATANAWCQLRCKEAGAELIAGTDPVLIPKAQKNETELNGMRNCHIRDGSAVSRYLAWIDREVEAGRLYDEGELSDKLESFRRELDDIHDLSFDTISAAGVNGALCHYNHMNGIPAMLEMNNLYLVDSGGQYLDGTTDITRTVVIGRPTDEHQRMFTLVLKGHIALARAIFPKGTSGIQLDILARQYLWQAGFDYDHGTGHGVGTFLSVHEGPQRIGKSGPQQELLPGMVISNEPGYYQENCFGIRCENLIVVRECDNDMLSFETITFAPFDTRLVDTSLMTPEEITWLNDYHDEVSAKLGPMLNEDDLDWLENATRTVV
ncbi:MAG: aminopeptidase P family protein [Gammaproteobacteria bacterium]|jgi:Xaa-Pro aminopeptidase|nr:aminopeptidase P family protein [Gammaproteobacteria bacterium]MBT7371608.1 aminopeptidase P family protein [Gammaproteobacteria bacterium]